MEDLLPQPQRTVRVVTFAFWTSVPAVFRTLAGHEVLRDLLNGRVLVCLAISSFPLILGPMCGDTPTSGGWMWVVRRFFLT